MTKRLPSRLRPRNMAIRNKLLAITITVVFIISLVSFTGFRLANKVSNRILYEQTANSLGMISDKISARLENVADVSLFVAVNRSLQDNLHIINQQQITATHAVARSDVSEIISRAFNNDIITCTVFPVGSRPVSWGRDSSLERNDVQEEAIRLAAQGEGAAMWLPSGRDDNSVLCVREIRSISQDFLKPIGILVIRVNLNRIVEESASSILRNGRYAIMIAQQDTIFFPTSEKDVLEPLKLGTLWSEQPYLITKVNGEQQFLVRLPMKMSRFRGEMILNIPYENIFRSLYIANAMYVVSLLSAALLTLVLSRRMLRSINRNLQTLKCKMDRVREGNLTGYPSADSFGDDELGRLNRHFDQMTIDFKKVIDDNYVKELLLTQTQLKALEQQINPHFLYNSLESINWFARRGETANISKIAQSLGRLLRSTLSEEEDKITLEQELYILDSYLEIQQIRFPDTLNVKQEIELGTGKIRVPKMSIQPLVENAIVHALEENIEGCHVWVRVRRKGDMIHIEVENDGSEMDVDILEKLRAKEVAAKGNGIGLINIDSRIKLLFGAAYGIHIASEEDSVLVSYQIPAEEKE